MSASAASVAAFARTSGRKLRKLVLYLDVSARLRNRHGEDLFDHVLWMRLDGHSIGTIAKTLGISTDTVGEQIRTWQQQIELKGGGAFQPKKRNPRRWRGKPLS